MGDSRSRGEDREREIAEANLPRQSNELLRPLGVVVQQKTKAEAPEVRAYYRSLFADVFEAAQAEKHPCVCHVDRLEARQVLYFVTSRFFDSEGEHHRCNTWPPDQEEYDLGLVRRTPINRGPIR